MLLSASMISLPNRLFISTRAWTPIAIPPGRLMAGALPSFGFRFRKVACPSVRAAKDNPGPFELPTPPPARVARFGAPNLAVAAFFTMPLRRTSSSGAPGIKSFSLGSATAGCTSIPFQRTAERPSSSPPEILKSKISRQVRTVPKYSSRRIRTTLTAATSGKFPSRQIVPPLSPAARGSKQLPYSPATIAPFSSSVPTRKPPCGPQSSLPREISATSPRNRFPRTFPHAV